MSPITFFAVSAPFPLNLLTASAAFPRIGEPSTRDNAGKDGVCIDNPRECSCGHNDELSRLWEAERFPAR